MADTISVVHHTTAIDSFMAAGDIRQEFITAPYPVSTTVQVARLYRSDLLIETTVIAEIPRQRFRRLPAEDSSR